MSDSYFLIYLFFPPASTHFLYNAVERKCILGQQLKQLASSPEQTLFYHILTTAGRGEARAGASSLNNSAFINEKGINDPRSMFKYGMSSLEIREDL